MLEEANIPNANVILREAKPNDIQHNKFMVLLKGKRRADGGVDRLDQSFRRRHSRPDQCRALGARRGHRQQFQAYWELLSEDPGPEGDDDLDRRKNKAFRAAVEDLQERRRPLRT